MDVGGIFSWAHWLFGVHCELSTSVSTVARSKEHTVLGRKEIWTVPDGVYCSTGVTDTPVGEEIAKVVCLANEAYVIV